MLDGINQPSTVITEGKQGEEWEKYQDLILEKEKNFKKYLFDDNKSILRILEKVFSKDFSYTEEEKQQILKTVRFILLPCNI